MPRVSRSALLRKPCLVHKIWRGHNKEYNLAEPQWKARYLEIMDQEREKKDAGCSLYAFVIMDNHVHELFAVEEQVAFSEFMRRHHSRYGMYFNRCQNRSGKVAEDRPKTCCIEDDSAFLEVLCYVLANPLRSKMSRRRALNYQWGTYALYAYGKKGPWSVKVELAPAYLRLGRSSQERQRKFRKIFAAHLKRFGERALAVFRAYYFGAPEWVLMRRAELKKWMLERSLGKSPP